MIDTIKEDILDIRYDRLFSDLFNANEMDTIEWIVMKLLRKSYDEVHNNVQVGNIKLNNTSKDNKQKYVDLVLFYQNIIIDIELNKRYRKSYLRNFFYVMNILINKYKVKSTYSEKYKGILINLNWENNKRQPPIIKYEYMFPEDNNKKEKENIVEVYQINLDYFSKVCYTGTSDYDVFYKLITRKTKKELQEIVNNEPLLVNYSNSLIRLSESEEYCRMVWDGRIDENLRRAEDYFEGVDDGEEKGKDETTKEVVKEMYKNKISINTIARCVKKTIPEVKAILML